MSESWLDQPAFKLGSLLRRLTEAEVDFVIIGGVAVVLQASPRFTRDLDICYATAQENLERLGGLLTDLGAKLRGIEEDLPFAPDPRTLTQTQILTLRTGEGDIDLLVEPAGSPDYAALRRRADRMDLDGLTVAVACIEDLIAMKRAAGRPQDLVDIEALELEHRRRR
ncbi:MAG: nucleotidyl transferase AbiEii/AbiGii toxin family protein [Solirubrobacterales bacterium]